MSSLQITMALAATVAVGTAYVLIHEHRRKLKKEQRKNAPQAEGGGGSAAARGGKGGAGPAITREQLIAILDESATAAYQLIEQVLHSLSDAPSGRTEAFRARPPGTGVVPVGRPAGRRPGRLSPLTHAVRVARRGGRPARWCS